MAAIFDARVVNRYWIDDYKVSHTTLYFEHLLTRGVAILGMMSVFQITFKALQANLARPKHYGATTTAMPLRGGYKGVN